MSKLPWRLIKTIVQGAFGKGSVRSQALLDCSAVMTCMAYFDLKPIRANMAANRDIKSY